MNPNATTIGNRTVRVLSGPLATTLAPDIQITTTTVEVIGLKIDPGSYFVGIDPGSVNMGLAVLSEGKATIYQIKLPSGISDSIQRIELTQRAVFGLLMPFMSQGKLKAACVEQAAYGALYGQPTLAEVRTAAAMAVRQLGCPAVMMTSPATIRKRIFGNGNMRSQEMWEYLPPDAGSALGCAMYAYII